MLQGANLVHLASQCMLVHSGVAAGGSVLGPAHVRRPRGTELPEKRMRKRAGLGSATFC